MLLGPAFPLLTAAAAAVEVRPQPTRVATAAGVLLALVFTIRKQSPRLFDGDAFACTGVPETTATVGPFG
jgi:hypothetical protein